MMIGIGVILCTYPSDLEDLGQSSNNFWLGLIAVVVLGLVLVQILISIKRRNGN